MNHEEFLRLASRHSDGLATEEEQHLLDEHVRSCPMCMDEVAESAAEAAEAQGQWKFAELRHRPFFRWWLGAAALFFLALFGWSELRLRAEREDALQLQANLDRMTTENERLFRRGQRTATVASVLAAPKTAVFFLSSGETGEASARLFIDPESLHGYLFAHSLRPSKPSERYQLWAVPRDGSASKRIATFNVAPGGDAAAKIENVPSLQTLSGFVLTREAPTVASPAAKPILRSTL